MKGHVAALVIACASLVAGASIATSARADEPKIEAASTIVVLCAPGDRLGLRLVAELESLGLRATVLDRAKLARAAPRANGAVPAHPLRRASASGSGSLRARRAATVPAPGISAVAR